MKHPDDLPSLSDDVVILRPHTLDDADRIVEQCRDADSVRWTTVPHPYRREDAVEFVTVTVPAGWAADSEYSFAVESGDGFAGTVDLRPFRPGVAELAFGLHPDARGRGVTVRAARLLIDWGFRELGLGVVVWYAYVGNWASRRVAWRLGFSFDGTIGSLLDQRGERRDAWTGSLRADDPREPAYPWLTAPVLDTGKLLLRPFTDGDAARLGEMENDARSRHFNGRVAGVWRPDGESVLLRLREKMAVGDRIDWCVADPSTGTALGHVSIGGFGGLDDTEVKASYMVHPDARGRGVLTESLRAVIEWAFRPVADGGFGKRRLTIGTAASNSASRHAAERAGLTHVATYPSAFTIGEDGFEDKVGYQVINPNWRP